jgi:hypothetical protein
MKDFLSHGSSKIELLIGLLAIVCLLLGAETFVSFMPGSLAMLLIGLFAALFALFTMLVWREKPRDEREALEIMAADRLGFLAGATVLSITVIIQTLRHQSSGLLVTALVAMILAKLAGKYVKM